MSGIYQKSRWSILAATLSIVVVLVLGARDLIRVSNWNPPAYQSAEFLNLTKNETKWDIRYGGDSLCGEIGCRDSSRETVVNFKRVLPNKTFGEEAMASDRVLVYHASINIPPEMLAEDLGIHFLYLFSHKFEFYVGDYLVKEGGGIFPGELPIPKSSYEASATGSSVDLTFKIDTNGVSEPGFDLRSNILIGPLAKLHSISEDKRMADRSFVLWLTIPRLIIAFMFGFGTLLFAYSNDYLYYVLYTVITAMKVPVFYGSSSVLGVKLGLSHNDLFNVLDLASTALMFLFVYRYFRQNRPKILSGFYWATGTFFALVIASLVLSSSQGTTLIGGWINTIYKLFCYGYFSAVSLSLYQYLRYTGRSPSRMYIAAVMTLCFVVSFLGIGLSVAFANEYWIPFLLLDLATASVFAACVSTDMGKVRVERDILRQKMGVHVDEGLVQELIHSDTFIARNVPDAAILFIDIRGFTEISESSSAKEIFDLLNDFHNQIIDCVYENQGVIDKFMGDSLMAVWGVRYYDKNSAIRAVRAAVAMSEKLAELNKNRAAEKKFPINYGIAVHLGAVVAGHIGNERRAEFSVIGSAVNIASRLEGMTSRLKRKILISNEVYQAIRDQVIVGDMGRHKIRGISDPVQVYSLIGVMAGRSDVVMVSDPRYSLETVKPWPHVVDERNEDEIAA